MAQTTFTFQIAPELSERIEAIAKSTYKPKAVIVRDAILLFLKEYDKTHGQTTPNPA